MFDGVLSYCLDISPVDNVKLERLAYEHFNVLRKEFEIASCLLEKYVSSENLRE